jgi:VWFA-related protein
MTPRGFSRVTCATAAVIAALAIVLLGAQSSRATQQPVFRTGADLVEVDVVVLDKDGHAVRGLTREDFTIADRKKPQNVVTFSEQTHDHALEGSSAQVFPPTLKRDVSSNQAAQADRLVVMVVDDLHIFQGRTDRAKELAYQIITDLGAQASMALIFTSGEHSTQITSDRLELFAAAETLKGRQSWRRPHQAIDAQVGKVGQADSGIGPGGSGRVASGSFAGPGGGLSTQRTISTFQSASLQEFEDNMAQYRTLQDAARLVGSDDARRKAFVLLSEGIGKDLRGMFDGPMTPCETDDGRLTDPRLDTGASTASPCYHDQALRDMMESMRRSNVATYAIDPRGQVRPEDMLRESSGPAGGGMLATQDGRASDEDSPLRWLNPVRQAQDGLSIVAKASGGFAVTDTDDFTSGLQQIIEDIDHYYLLGFYPADPSGKGYRPLNVTVPGHPDWTVRFRQGYEPGGAPPPPMNTDALAALSAGVMPKTALPLRLFATAFPGAGALAHVEGAIEITASTRDLVEADTRLHDDLSYEVIVVDDNKSTVTSRSAQGARFVLRQVSPTATMPDIVAYQIPLSLDLAPGQYQFRASALSAKLGKGGSVYLTVDVPDFSKDTIALSGLVLGYAEGSHVPVGRTTASAVSPALPALSALPASAGSPASPAELPFDPALDREFLRTDTVRLYFEIARKNPDVAVHTTLELVDALDHVPQRFEGDSPAGDPGRVDVSFKLDELEPGPYRLRVSATDGTHTVSREIGLIVR